MSFAAVKALIVVLLVFIAGSLGYLVYDRQQERKRVEAKEQEEHHEKAIKAAVLVAEAQSAKKAQDDIDAKARLEAAIEQLLRNKIAAAMLANRVIPGMSIHQVRQIWGSTSGVKNGSQITDDERAAGFFEIWNYEDARKGIVFFDADGTVIAVRHYKMDRDDVTELKRKLVLSLNEAVDKTKAAHKIFSQFAVRIQRDGNKFQPSIEELDSFITSSEAAATSMERVDDAVERLVEGGLMKDGMAAEFAELKNRIDRHAACARKLETGTLDSTSLPQYQEDANTMPITPAFIAELKTYLK